MQRFRLSINLFVLFVTLAVVAIPIRVEARDYRLQPEDVLQITVYEQPDLNITVRITSDGKIAFPLIGKVSVVGLSISEVEDKITDLLAADYLVNPQVQVFISEYHVKQISVLGSVNTPGKYDMYTEKETTVLQAIAMAGGFSDVASINNTRIIRNEDGEQKIIPIKVTDITTKGMKDKDVALQPGDIVYVPESFF
ncbi:MAG: polysaccharide biosynthesis/export family protein [Candidatus Omnitrophota bacterium]